MLLSSRLPKALILSRFRYYGSFSSFSTTTTRSTSSDDQKSHQRQRHQRQRIVTLPNILTLIRMLVLAPSAGYLIVSGEYSTAAYVVAAAGALDALDGWVARTFDQKSTLGSYLDPAADKLLLVTCFVTLGSQGVIPEWLVALVVARDVGLVMGTAMMMSQESLWREKRSGDSGSGGDSGKRSSSGGGGDDKNSRHTNDGGYRRIRPSLLSKVNTALQISLVCCGLSSAAWNVPPAPSPDVANFLQWKWKKKNDDDDDVDKILVEGDLESGGGKIDTKGSGRTNPANNKSEIGSSERREEIGPVFSLLLPALASSVALTTFASGLDYLFVAVRMLR